MGVYNTYLDVQLKVGELTCEVYNLGDRVDIPDGVYLGYEGVVVIYDGKFIARHKQFITKWGNAIAPSEILKGKSPLSLLERGGAK